MNITIEKKKRKDFPLRKEKKWNETVKDNKCAKKPITLTALHMYGTLACVNFNIQTTSSNGNVE